VYANDQGTKDLSKLAVDAIFCISLTSRQDRRAQFQAQFSASGLDVEFILVERDSADPQRGCYNSHLQCAALAISRGYKRVLIFEDDATLLPFRESLVMRINRFLEVRDPEMFYLGAMLGKLWMTWSPSIARIRAQGAHAYMLSADGCKKVMALGDYNGRGIDSCYSKMFVGYGCFPLISQQQPADACRSDIQGFRSEDLTYFDARFWKDQSRKQYVSALKGLPKTLIRKGF
jgi:glycosyl transferase family 25